MFERTRGFRRFLKGQPVLENHVVGSVFAFQRIEKHFRIQRPFSERDPDDPEAHAIRVRLYAVVLEMKVDRIRGQQANGLLRPFMGADGIGHIQANSDGIVIYRIENVDQ